MCHSHRSMLVLTTALHVIACVHRWVGRKHSNIPWWQTQGFHMYVSCTPEVSSFPVEYIHYYSWQHNTRCTLTPEGIGTGPGAVSSCESFSSVVVDVMCEDIARFSIATLLPTSSTLCWWPLCSVIVIDSVLIPVGSWSLSNWVWIGEPFLLPSV